ncbi:putative Zinc finger C2H2-type [Septoria linicola]|nr:putative Zinc finger C2H2-type [Septoria linicola]
MAATTRSTTPLSSSLNAAAASGAPRTPTSSTSGLGAANHGALENPHLLRPISQKPDSRTSLSPRSDKAHLSPRSTPLPLTGAAAMAEMKRRKQAEGSRQTSPNPQVAAMQSLLGTGGMSRPTDAPAPDKMSSPLRKVAERISIPDSNAQTEQDQDASPVSLGSFGSTIEGTNSGHAMTVTASDHTTGPNFVAEPADLNEGTSYTSHNGNLAPQEQHSKNMSLSYPGLPPQHPDGQEGGSARSMTLPGSGLGQSSPKSPASNKRHKCPYCSTDFTRHHNLKSHLLTHSQEKPYVCQTCQARFRRLHDLKRHTKLHTGERPHTCDKCGRKFARGDALARHNKGPGGCAGRRSSFGGDDEDADGYEGMDGVEYDDEGIDEHGRRKSHKRQQLETPQDSDRSVYRQHSSTYPPAPRQMQGSMAPPQVVHPGGATSPRDMSGQPSPAGGSISSSYYGQGQVFAEPGMMTSSPKPLSPGQPHDQHRLSVGDGSAQLGRNRSTSLNTQFQQQHFGRGSGTGVRSPPQPSNQFAPNPNQVPPQHNILPPLGAQPPMRGVLQPGAQPNMMHNPQVYPAPGMGSNPGSLSSHGRSSGSSMRDIAGQGGNPSSDDIWGYVRTLEQRLSRMGDEYELRISRMQEEIISLKGQLGQLSNQASYSSDMGRQGPYP